MQKRSDSRRGQSESVDALNEGVLYEVGARDEWQAQLVTADGGYGGTVIRKVIEPASYLVRYLIVHHSQQGRHLLIPAGTIVGGDLGEIYCSLERAVIDRLPTYTFLPITREFEQQVYDSVGMLPHWEE